MSKLVIDEEALKVAVKSAETEAARQAEQEHLRELEVIRMNILHHQRRGEMEELLKKFFESSEGLGLRQALKDIGKHELSLPRGAGVDILRWKQDGSLEFVKVWISGGYFVTRTETLHTLEGFADFLVSDSHLEPAHLLLNLRRGIQMGWDQAFHWYRMKHDAGYREKVYAESQARAKKATRKFWVWLFGIIGSAVTVGIYFF